MTKKPSNKLLWIDLEMTGLDPTKDRILEVGAIITDWDLETISSYESSVKVSSNLLKKRMLVADEFWSKFPDLKKQIIKQNSEAYLSLIDVEDELLGYISADFAADEKIILAGNSIHQDRKFIEKWWPRLNERLHYRMLDVSAWKVVFEGKYDVKFKKPEMHRALSDIKGSIEELKYYTKRVSLNDSKRN